MFEVFYDLAEPIHILLLFAVCFAVIYLYVRSRKPTLPKLYHADTELNRHVISHVTRLTSNYSPPRLLMNRHIQCFLSCFGDYRQDDFKREYVSLNDGGVVALDWVKTPGKCLPASAPILLVVSGIIGSKVPVSFLCKLASRKQYRVVVFNKRGHDNSELTTPVLTTFGDPRDLRECLKFIYQKYASSKIAAVGYSAGCGLLSSYLGHYNGESFISTAVFIASGFNVGHLCLTNISRFYERIIVSSLRTKLIKPHTDILQSAMDLNAVNKCTTLREFDYHVYCKMHGYRDVAELWTDNNPMKHIHNIDVPVLCINSLDDPVCLSSNIPYGLFKRPGWMLVTTERGGHVSFYDNWRLESWADRCAVDYINTVIGFQNTLSDNKS